ncbi:MAG: MgtC/SapB family protein [Chloroflexi bacterium]|nr:MgtC/SapB family protein [Chloroflexota bacterium]MCI0783282.1 MgtC/SapB family protein [Chloroflexota bacterium]MCI0814028.1 MgtC/SapB family protein [Chloroflexota bacterium]MCI0817446.1 MgtC/SapB family protein [Chloroflexota bacterium]MCI0820128.1 MgtC/SapB family protein [Chloroflexota bacterium]
MDLSTTDELEIVARLVLAAAVGGFVGLERELRGYPAGIRTLALVAIGATLFTEISQLLGGNDRVAAQIVTGIGFIGAGLIFREGYSVRGITTAATIWAVAAMGMAIGVQLYIVAIAGAVLLFLVLEAQPLTRRVERAVSPREDGLRRALAPDDEDGDERIKDED